MCPQILDNVEIALESLASRKLGTFLSIVGIIIGVAAVIIVGSITVSGHEIIFKEMETFGLKSLWVWSYYNDQLGRGRPPGTGVVLDDIPAILRECRHVKRISPVVKKRGVAASSGANSLRVDLVCANSDYTLINNDTIAVGRQITPNDVRRRNRVCLIGTRVANGLFGREDPVGELLRLDSILYKVVGILKRKDRDFISNLSSSDQYSVDGRVVIPISVYQVQYNSREVGHLHAEATNVSRARDAGHQIVQVLQRRHKGRYQYKFDTMQQYVEVTQNVLLTVSWVGGLAAAISLVVGGIGIMNMMATTVVERTREIGMRKALGATHGDVVWQFLMESVLVSLLGGMIGTGVGIGLIHVIELLSKKPVSLAPLYILVALSVSFVVGICSGIYPAIRAATMDPVDALRTE